MLEWCQILSPYFQPFIWCSHHRPLTVIHSVNRCILSALCCIYKSSHSMQGQYQDHLCIYCEFMLYHSSTSIFLHLWKGMTRPNHPIISPHRWQQYEGCLLILQLRNVVVNLPVRGATHSSIHHNQNSHLKTWHILAQSTRRIFRCQNVVDLQDVRLSIV